MHWVGSLLIFCLGFLISISGYPDSVPPVNTVDTVSLTQAGSWDLRADLRMAFNQGTGRIFSVVRSGDPDQQKYYRILSLDISTSSFAAGEPLSVTSGYQCRGLAVSPLTNELYIGWDTLQPGDTSEARRPSHVQIVNTETFSATSSLRLDIGFYDLVSDTSGEAIYGLAVPEPPDNHFRLTRFQTSDRSINSVPIGLTTSQVMPQDMVLDFPKGRFIILFVPLKPGSSDLVEQKGFVAAYDLITGATTAKSVLFDGEFTQDSLALSPDGNSLVVAGGESHGGKMPVFEATSLTKLYDLEEPSDFSSNEAVVFTSTGEIWVANDKESNPGKSIAIYQLPEIFPSAYIPDASQVGSFIFDSVNQRGFAASHELNSLYVLSREEQKQVAVLDIGVIPYDLLVDPGQNQFLLLSELGRSYLVSDRINDPVQVSPRLISRLPTSGSYPRAGILPDPELNRVIIGKNPKYPPAIFDSLTFQQTGSLPVPAEAMALNVIHNAYYTISAASLSNPWEGHKIQKVNRNTLAVLDPQVALLPDVLIPPANGIGENMEMQVDAAGQFLWILAPGLLDSPSLRALNLADKSVRRYDFTTTFTVNHLYLNESHRQVIVADNNHLYSFPMDATTLFPSVIPVPGVDSIFDFVADPNHGALYYLSYSFSLGYELIEVQPSPVSITNRCPLPFLNGVSAGLKTPVVLTLNPLTNRFAISSTYGVHFFDNPFHTLPKDKANPPQVTAQILQSNHGIALSWSVDPSLIDKVDGWFIERKAEPVDGDLLAEDWIRLVPSSLPASATTWTDTTVESGVLYRYQIRALSDQIASLPAITATCSWTGSPGNWLATIPEVELRLHPSESLDLTLFAQSAKPSLSGVSVEIVNTTPMILSATPSQIPLPGTARLQLTCPPAAPPRLHLVYVHIHETDSQVDVPLLVRVYPPSTQIVTTRIPRNPTPIYLSSDARLDGQRFSVRGQLGIPRTTAAPTGLKVSALSPAGTILEATGVIAATGEFTAEFILNDTRPAEGDWKFRATWNGSNEYIGGNSQIFYLPLLPLRSQKDGSASNELGNIVLVKGKPMSTSEETALNALSDSIYETFVSNRYKNLDDSTDGNTIGTIIQAGANRQNLNDAVNIARNASRYVLFYFLGDAVKIGNECRFKLESGEEVSPTELRQLVGQTGTGAIPLVVLDSPYASSFKQELSSLPGGYVFSCASEYNFSSGIKQTDQLFGFSGPFNSYIKDGDKFIQAARMIQTENILANASFTNLPVPELYTSNGFQDVSVLSAFTLPRALQPDGIPPQIINLSPSRIVGFGETIPVSFEISDFPFEHNLKRILVAIIEPDGSYKEILIQPVAGESQFQFSVDASLPGLTFIQVYVEDQDGNHGETTTSFYTRMTRKDLITALEQYRQRGKEQSIRNRIESFLWLAGLNWQ